MKKSLKILTIAALALLVSCGRAPEKVAEKAIESAMERDGTKAKVDLSTGGTKITTTDSSGKTSQVEIGGATITESDVGLPFYPGTKPLEGQATRITTPQGTAVTVALHTEEAPNKVVAFYRERLKAQAEGKQLMEMNNGDSNTTLVLADDKSKTSFQVHINKAEKGTDVQIMANHGSNK